MRFHALAILIGLAACGEDSISLDDFEAEIVKAQCKVFTRCGATESVDSCLHANFASGRLSASVQAIFDMGKAKYDGAKARECLDGLASESCDTTSKSARVQPAACDALASGTIHDAGTCGNSLECISQKCTIPTCGTPCCQGTCTGDSKPVDAKLGESCTNASCVAGTHCDTTSTTCVALKPSGMACTTSTECDYGLACTGTTARTCAALPKLDEACSGQCRDIGTACSPTTQTCVKLGFANAPCTSSAECGIAYRCNAAKVCAPGIALGASCVANDFCADTGAFCDVPMGQTMGTCTLPKPDGQMCQRNSNCEHRNCDPVSLMCAPEAVCI